MARTILVTGGAGFIGSALAHALINRGFAVVVADNLSTGKRENVPAEAAFIEMDMGKKEDYAKLAGVQFDAVCHLAAQSSGEASFLDPQNDFDSHALSTFLLLEECKRCDVRRFLYASSMALYGDPQYQPVDEAHPANPKTYYAAGKLASEAYIKFYQSLEIETTVFRLFSVYGPNQNLDNKYQGMVSIFLSYILDNEPVHVKGARERFRDFMFIDDVVNAWLLALDNPASYGKTYNIASGRKTTVEELITTELECMGKPDHPVFYEGSTPGDQFGVYGSSAKLQEELGWRPEHSLKEGLTAMVQFYTR